MASSGEAIRTGGEAIRAEGLTRAYPNGVVGLRGLDLTVRHGEVVGLLGRSGSGKTTLFRLLVGAIRPTGGSLTVLGTDLTRARPAELRRLRRRLAWVGQQHNLVAGLSVGHNVLLGRLGREPLWRVLARLIHLPEPDRRAAFAALADLGVADKLYDRADELSGGQQQRVAVARALVGEPELLLADEPVASVDEQTAADVLGACLRANRERGATFLVSLHQPELALRYCPRIVILAAGSVMYDGPPDGIDRAALYDQGSLYDREEVRHARHDGAPPQPRFEDVRGPGFSPLNIVLALILGGVIVLSFQQSRVSIFEPFDPRNVRSVTRFVAGLFPPAMAPAFLRTIGGLLLETIWLSIAGTTLAFLLAVPLAIGAMRSRGEELSRAGLGTAGWLGMWAVYGLSRTVLNVARSIPELVWALVFVVAVGLGPFAGVLALAVHSAGILGKLYAELLESVDQRVVEAARATGAGEGAVTLLARVPMALPVLLSYTLFRWECNMRAATVLGFVGAGGIGTQLSISMKLFQYNEVLTLALAILLLVTLVDVVGGIARARVLDAPSIAACERSERRGIVGRAVAFFGRADG